MKKKKNPWGVAHPSKQIRENAIYNNARMYNFYYDNMCDIALARYKWTGLPDTIDARFLEQCLLFKGGFVSWIDDVMFNHQIAPFSVIGRYNNQGNPVNVNAYSPYTGFHQYLDIIRDHAIICWNNFIRKPDIIGVQLFAERLADLERTIDINVKNQKTPKFILANDYQKISIQNAVASSELNCPIIYVKDNFDPKEITEIDMTVPYTADKLDIHRLYIWNEFLNFMGIDNQNQFKQERLVSKEVGSNEENVEMSRNTNLETRKEFCRKFNTLYPEYHIDVNFNSLISKANILNKFVQIGGDRTGDLYNDIMGAS